MEKCDMIKQYTPLIKSIIKKMFNHIPYNIEYDDLMDYGIIGLIEAMHMFDVNKNVQFQTYAYYRIRYNMQCGIHNFNEIPYSMKQNLRMISFNVVDENQDCIESNKCYIPDKIFRKNEIKNILSEEIQKLSFNEKKVIILHYYKYLSIKEIAVKMETSYWKAYRFKESAENQLRDKLIRRLL